MERRQRVPVHKENSETLPDQQESNGMIQQHSWDVALDIKNLSLGMPSVLQALTEGMMSIYWLMGSPRDRHCECDDATAS